MIFIGVTGGIGSGKSTVCSFFERKGIPIFFADTVAKEIVDSNAEVLHAIIDVFGEEVLNSSKQLNRKALAEIVFKDNLLLEKLNAIVHPKVFNLFEQWKQNFPFSTRYALVESALLFESGMFEMVDYALAVIANEDIRVARVVSRDSMDSKHVKSRMDRQISIEELMELSDFQIQNNGSISDLALKVNFFHTLFSTLTIPKEIE